MEHLVDTVESVFENDTGFDGIRALQFAHKRVGGTDHEILLLLRHRKLLEHSTVDRPHSSISSISSSSGVGGG